MRIKAKFKYFFLNSKVEYIKYRSYHLNISKKKYQNNFAITGTGRSGTKFLANILNMSNKYRVIHEYDYDYIAAKQKYYLSIVQSRFKNYYGEANSHLRYIFQDLLVDKKVVIIRNPKEVILSAMNRHRDWIEKKSFYTYITRLNSALYILDSEIDNGTYMVRFDELINNIECIKRLCDFLEIDDI